MGSTGPHPANDADDGDQDEDDDGRNRLAVVAAFIGDVVHDVHRGGGLAGEGVSPEVVGGLVQLVPVLVQEMVGDERVDVGDGREPVPGGDGPAIPVPQMRDGMAGRPRTCRHSSRAAMEAP